MCTKLFSVSNEQIQFAFDSGPDPVYLTVEDLVDEMTATSQENPQPPWNGTSYCLKDDIFSKIV